MDITTLACLRTLYEPVRDQVADRMSPDTVFETQEQMLVRYQQTL